MASSERFLSEDGDLPDYAQKLIQGVEAHQIEIDRMPTSTSPRTGALARMPIVDRSILRWLATFEMAYMDDVPVSGDHQRGRGAGERLMAARTSRRGFVNGVLGRIAVQLEERVQAANEEGARKTERAHMRQARRLTKACKRKTQVASAPAGEGAQDAGPAEDVHASLARWKVSVHDGRVRNLRRRAGTLDEIVDEVNAEGVGLDDALALYEEGRQAGAFACDLSEEGALALMDLSDGEQHEGVAEAEGAQGSETDAPAKSEAAAGVEEAGSPRGAVRPARGKRRSRRPTMDDKRIPGRGAIARRPGSCLSDEELALLACEIREEIVTVTSQTGGHVASSLGAVEIILAAHSLLDCPTDKLVFDVGHQAYAHKLVTGRLTCSTRCARMAASRFPSPDESSYDVHPSGHASDSLSVASRP